MNLHRSHSKQTAEPSGHRLIKLSIWGRFTAPLERLVGYLPAGVGGSTRGTVLRHGDGTDGGSVSTFIPTDFRKHKEGTLIPTAKQGMFCKCTCSPGTRLNEFFFPYIP